MTNLHFFISLISILFKRENRPFKIVNVFNLISIQQLDAFFNGYSNDHNQLLIDLSVSYSDISQCKVICEKGLANKNLNKIMLNLLHCPIEDSGVSTLCLKISQIQGIKELNLNFGLTLCTESGVISICTMVKQLKNLEELRINLYGNKIGQSGYRELIKTVSTLQNLKRLTLGFRKTELDTQQLENTGVYLNKLTNLTHLKLNLKDSQLQNGLSHIFTGFSQFENLIQFRLNLEISSIDDQDLQILASNIERNQIIQYLSLNFKNNQISKDTINNLMNKIADKKQLFQFKFRALYMQIQEQEIRNIQKLILNKMSNLKILIDDLNMGMRISIQERKKWQQQKLKMKYLVSYSDKPTKNKI